MEVPILSDEERKQMFTRIWVRHLYGAARFIVERLGDEGLEDYNERRTGESAEHFRKTKKDNSAGFAMAQAIVSKNIFGSEVEVLEDRDVTLVIKRCARLEAVLEMAEKGKSITRAQYCGLCINGYYKKVAGKLRLNLDADFTDRGCRMVIRRISD